MSIRNHYIICLILPFFQFVLCWRSFIVLTKIAGVGERAGCDVTAAQTSETQRDKVPDALVSLLDRIVDQLKMFFNWSCAFPPTKITPRSESGDV
ncbi:hypothetical protein B0H12DRAFT_1147750 [Mycena haematopus]|nr:hypothetical protein B0H12DRAFT_1147750 [Mycena haematopus]